MNKGLNRFTLLVTGATFVLLIAGALVTSHDAGLATPDWPLSNGQVFPKMVGNLFWEHGHRLVATTVGLLTIVLTAYLYAVDVLLLEVIRWLGSFFVENGAVKFRERLSTVEAERKRREPRRWIRKLAL